MVIFLSIVFLILGYEYLLRKGKITKIIDSTLKISLLFYVLVSFISLVITLLRGNGLIADTKNLITGAQINVIKDASYTSMEFSINFFVFFIGYLIIASFVYYILKKINNSKQVN